MNLRLLAPDPLSCAVRNLISDWRFMASHGWTKERYILRYGTTASPKLGDGGPLIWQADIDAHQKARQAVIRATNPSHRDSSKKYHRIAWKLWKHMHSPREHQRWVALLEAARRVKQKNAA